MDEFINGISSSDGSESDRSGQEWEKLAGKFMTFKLAEEEYGLQILNVKEIIGYMRITRIPQTPDFIRGLINLRGKVFPVIDLRLKFNMEEIEPTEQTVIIVVQMRSGDSDATMGIIVDEVLEVLDVQADAIEPPPSFGSSGIDSDFILGVGKSEKRVIFLLDISRVLTLQETRIIARHFESENALPDDKIMNV